MPGNKSAVKITWTDETWKNDINITYYRVRVEQGDELDYEWENFTTVSFYDLAYYFHIDFSINSIRRIFKFLA